jgi:hypothetical protein
VNKEVGMMARGGIRRGLLALAVMLLSALPALAQDGAAEAEAAGAAGVTTLALLLGIGAVFVVGLVTIARERFNNKE